MRRSKGGARKTHYAIRQSGETDNGVMSQANSFGPCCRHFFPCDEGASPTTITDAVGGVVLNTAVATDMTMATGATNTVRIGTGATPTNIGITGAWDQPAGSDVVIMVCAKARINSGHADNDYGGFISFYYGGVSEQQMRVQPYYATFNDATLGPPDDYKALATPVYKPLLQRTDGQNYMFAAVKRGNALEHYADGVLTGTNNITRANSTTQASWNNFTPPAEMWASHAAYGDPDLGADIGLCNSDNQIDQVGAGVCDFDYTGHIDRGAPDNFKELSGTWVASSDNAGATGEYPQDYYGFAVFIFEDGAPNDVGVAMNWMKEQWTSGNKVIYPGWVTLK